MRDLVDTNRLIDRVFENFWNDGRTDWNLPALDVLDKDNQIIVKAELPGYTPEQIDVRVEGDVLHLKGQVATETERDEEGQYHLRERSMRSFSRSIRLPNAVDSEKAQATFENGILTLTLPKNEQALPKRINIAPVKTIEANHK
jgi:HSP20 family protein